MNPITNMKNVNKLNDQELEMGLAGTKSSWHSQYSDSAWVFIGGLPYDLTEGDVISVFSQYGEIVHINLVRDHQTGKSRGFGFICYEDQRSTILAVDNLNGMKLLGRFVRVDHVQTYKLPKDLEKLDQDRKKLLLEGCAPKPITMEPHDADGSSESIQADDANDSEPDRQRRSHKKHKKSKKKKKSSKSKSTGGEEGTSRKRRSRRSSSSDSSGSGHRAGSKSIRRREERLHSRSRSRDRRKRRSRSP